MSRHRAPKPVTRLFESIDADLRRTARALRLRRRKPKREREDDVWWSVRLRRSFGSARLRIFIRVDPALASHDLCNVTVEISFGGIASDGTWLKMSERSPHASRVGDVIREMSAWPIASLHALHLPTRRVRVTPSA